MNPLEAIRQRQARLAVERTSLASQLAAIDREISDLHTAERVLCGLSEAPSDFSVAVPEPVGKHIGPILSKLKRRATGRQIKEMALEVLRAAYPDSLKASEIRQGCLGRFGVDINSNTLTVSLARYRDQGLVDLANRAWCYIPDRDDAWQDGEASEIRSGDGRTQC